MIQLTHEDWQTVRKAAKYTNGTTVPRHVEFSALKALQDLVKRLETK